MNIYFCVSHRTALSKVSNISTQWKRFYYKMFNDFRITFWWTAPHRPTRCAAGTY